MSLVHRKIPLRATVFEAHRLVYRNLPFLVRIGWPWVVALIVVLVVGSWINHALYFSYNEAFRLSDWLFWLLDETMTLALGVPLAVAWHRFVIMEERATAAFTVELWREYLIYFLLGALIWLAFFAPAVAATELLNTSMSYLASVDDSAPVNSEQTATSSNESETAFACLVCYFVLPIIGLAFFMPLSYVPARLSLALPASAIGTQKKPLNTSWTMTRGSFLSLFFGMMLTSWPLIVGLAISIWITPYTHTNQVYFVLDHAVIGVLYFAAGILWVAFLSVAYKQSVERLGHQQFALIARGMK